MMSASAAAPVSELSAFSDVSSTSARALQRRANVRGGRVFRAARTPSSSQRQSDPSGFGAARLGRADSLLDTATSPRVGKPAGLAPGSAMPGRNPKRGRDATDGPFPPDKKQKGPQPWAPDSSGGRDPKYKPLTDVYASSQHVRNPHPALLASGAPASISPGSDPRRRPSYKPLADVYANSPRVAPQRDGAIILAGTLMPAARADTGTVMITEAMYPARRLTAVARTAARSRSARPKRHSGSARARAANRSSGMLHVSCTSSAMESDIRCSTRAVSVRAH